MSGNALSGPLPTNWGWNNVLTLLEVLSLDGNALSGSIPAGFGTSGAFKSLLLLNLDGNKFSGGLLGWMEQMGHVNRMKNRSDFFSCSSSNESMERNLTCSCFTSSACMMHGHASMHQHDMCMYLQP